MKKNLSFRYALQQMVHCSTYAGAMTFASAYLMAKGFTAAQVGTLLALSNLLSCAAQPLMAARVDRVGNQVVPRYMAGMCLTSIICFLSLWILPAGGWAFALAYLTGVFAYDAMTPLTNALCVAWRKAGYQINYGFGRGMGSFAYSLLALAIGQVIAQWGGDWMVVIVIALLVTDAAVVLSFPRIEKSVKEAAENRCCSLGVFFVRYRWYCLSLVGVMLLAAFHIMVENYMIKVMERLGGDSGHVGVAMFLATAVATVTMVFFDRIRSRTGNTLLLKLAGMFYVLKAVCFMLAPCVEAIYAAQLLQAVTYAFLSPTQMYYANSRIAAQDMVKGQAFITASYTLGCALGNFAGGQLVEGWGVGVMLAAGLGVALAGTAILFISVNRRDRYMQEAG